MKFCRFDLSSDFAATVHDRSRKNLLTAEELRYQVRIGRFSKAALQALGLRDLDVVTSLSVLTKMVGKHGLGPDALAQLRDIVLNPVSVYKSDTFPGSVVVVSAMLPDGANPLLMAIRVDKPDSAGKTNIHWMVSAYVKETPGILEKWEEKGLLLWRP